MVLRRSLVALFLLTLGSAFATGCNTEKSAGEAGGAAAAKSDVIRAGDPWNTAQVIEPADLAATLKAESGEKPLLLHVGFHRLFEEGGIPGSQYAGPGQTAEGIALLEQTVAAVPKGKDIVVYCGCCPWKNCPNMAPAFRKLSELGYTNVRALHVKENFTVDWVDAGYPVDAPHR